MHFSRWVRCGLAMTASMSPTVPTHSRLGFSEFSVALLVSAALVACGGNDGSSDDASGGSASGGSGATSGSGGAASGGAHGSGGSATVSDEPAGVQYFGRWELSDDGSAKGSWGALYFKVRFEGTSIALLLEDAANEFQYRVDGGMMQVLHPAGQTRYELASGLSDGEHLLEVFRRSGGSFGQTVVRGVELDPGKNVLAPFERKTRLIEVVGDSISVGYGNEGTGATSRETENGYEAYGPQLARLLDADWSIVAHSGQGLFRNLGQEKASVASSLQMPEEFKLTFFPGPTPNPDWDFSRFEPDVFIVTLGTNDFSWKVWNEDPGPEWEPTEEEFVGEAKAFLGFVRDKYPSAEIFAVGTFIATSQNQFGRANQYLCTTIDELSDEHAHCVDPGANGPDGAWLTSGADFIGDWTHPTVAGHTLIAEHLRDTIAPIMGW